MILYKKPKREITGDEYRAKLHKEWEERRKPKPKDELAVKIGEQVKQIRISMNLNQQEFAQLAGFKQSAISRLETGNYLPKLSILKRFASRLGLNVEVNITHEKD